MTHVKSLVLFNQLRTHRRHHLFIPKNIQGLKNSVQTAGLNGHTSAQCTVAIIYMCVTSNHIKTYYLKYSEKFTSKTDCLKLFNELKFTVYSREFHTFMKISTKIIPIVLSHLGLYNLRIPMSFLQCSHVKTFFIIIIIIITDRQNYVCSATDEKSK